MESCKRGNRFTVILEEDEYGELAHRSRQLSALLGEIDSLEDARYTKNGAREAEWSRHIVRKLLRVVKETA